MLRWTSRTMALLGVAIVALGLSATAGARQADDDGFVPIFNGEDLSGWEGDPALWSVEDGAITGRTTDAEPLPYNKFLIWRGGTVADFELRTQFRLEGDSNSGIQYRSAQLPDAGEFVVGGYQADIHPNPSYLGMLYDERGRGIVAQSGQRVEVGKDGKIAVVGTIEDVPKVDLTEWNELTILARGNRLEHKINGKTVATIVDNQESERELEGILALQVHRGPAMRVQFKDVRLRRIGGDQKEDEPVAALAPADANPSWLWLGDPKQNLDVSFRKEFNVQGRVRSARLVATCDNEMVISLNGEEVLKGNAWERPVSADVAEALRPGRNVIAVAARNHGPGAAGLLLRLTIEPRRGETVSLITDATWSAATDPADGWRARDFDAADWASADVVGRLGDGPWNQINAAVLASATSPVEPAATDPATMKVAEGFRVDLLYSVPSESQGSWVAMTADPKGRLIVSDQYGKLYRVTVPAVDDEEGEVDVEPIDVEIGAAQGLLWAYDRLYVMVNSGGPYKSGLHIVTDSDGDDQLDTVVMVRELNGGGEHGPHAIIPSPDGVGLFVVCGNQTRRTDVVASRVPPVFGEDQLLPRQPDGNGFMAGVLAPGGCIYRINPEGTEWELISIGYRNPYDIAFNRDGELFTYDADMEWDINTPWYRPTRICHVVSGSDYGWRNGTGKFPPYYIDTVPAAVDIGPGSPTGITFGYGAAFPAKYRDALFINDWSYGKLYAVHLEPDGASYTGTFEEFITGSPLPLTDLIIHPTDGAMYFAIGGRRTTSGLYRVTYVGDEPVRDAAATDEGKDLRGLRRRIEAFHGVRDRRSITEIWPYLGHPDRFIRYAARVALEFQENEVWQSEALIEPTPEAALNALLALIRVSAPDPDHRRPDDPPVNLELKARIVQSLDRLTWDALTPAQRIDQQRVYAVLFNRMGPPDEETRSALLARFEPHYPTGDRILDAELTRLLVYLQSPDVAAEAVARLEAAPTQEEQIQYAQMLRVLQVGWTPELRERYFQWFVKAAHYRGGASFGNFIRHIREEAVAALDEAERERLAPILAEAEAPASTAPTVNRPFVRDWTLDELAPALEGGLANDRDLGRGRRLFAEANCYSCHRFAGEGGAVGPDLTGVSGRFSPRDLLESMLDPNKTISDQYQAVMIATVDGRVITGRIVNLSGNSMNVMTNMLDPNAQVGVDRRMIEEIQPSPVSMMPEGLLDTLSEEEVFDLMAYLLSGDKTEVAGSE